MAIAIGQHATGENGFSTTVSTTAINTAASGSTFVALGTADSAPGASPISDTINGAASGNVWVNKAVNVQFNGAQRWLNAWVCANGNGGTNHVLTLVNSGTGGITAALVELTGAATSSFDQVATLASQSGTTLSAPSVTTTSANELVLAVFGRAGNSTLSAPTNSFTLGDQVSDTSNECSMGWSSRVVSATGTYSTAATCSGNADYGSATLSFIAGAGGGVTETLAGQSVNSTEGSVTAALSASLIGQSITSTLGTITPSIAYAVTGRSLVSGLGSIVPSLAHALVGQSAVFTEGTISASTGGNVTLSLTGQAIASALGTLTPALSATLGGQSVTSAHGALSGTLSHAITGQAISSIEGALGSSVAYGLAGQSITAAQGTITPQQNGNVTRTLTGLTASLTLGTLSVSVSGATIPMPSLVGLNYYEALEALQTLGIYVPLPAYAFAPSSINVTWAKSTLRGGLVAAQSPSAGSGTIPNQPVTLTLSTFPFGSMIDTPPDWRQVN